MWIEHTLITLLMIVMVAFTNSHDGSVSQNHSDNDLYGFGKYSTQQTDDSNTAAYLQRILELLQATHHDSHRIGMSTKLCSEWMLFAYIIDRVFLVMFVSCALILGLVLLLQYAYNPQGEPDVAEVVKDFL